MQATEPIAEYRITFADLIEIADAACDLDGYTGLLVDHPADIALVKRRVERLHNLIQRVLGEDEWLIYGKDERAP